MNNLKGGKAHDGSIAWLTMEDSFFWQSKVDALGFGQMETTVGSMNGDVPYSFKFEGERSYLSIFNTGTSFTLIPGELWVSWSDHLI
jgi:hypothetical protein